MAPLLTRSRTIRGATSPAESPLKEREPFTLGPFRQQKSFSAGANSGRRSRGNGENVPPDNVYTAAYVKANTVNQDGGSPAQCRSASKGRNGSAAPLPGSPALLPRPPLSKPYPAAQSRPKIEAANTPSQDELGGAKRKISWDINGGALTESSTSCLPAEVDGSDSGVKVIVRMRPLNAKEDQEEATQVVQKISANAVALGDQQFTYDAVAGEDASQQEVFGMVGLPMVENCLAGFNSSIFAYGQTGSGKTHTMWGATSDAGAPDLPPSEDRGISPRVFEKLFARMQEEEKLNVDKGLRYQCRCSFLEIYNEQITDLLDPTQKTLQIREDTKTGVYVDNLSEEYVSIVDDVTRLLLKGLSNRRTGSTAMNNESSRSHSVFTCVIDCRYKNLADGCNCVRSSRMNLVDLAGSERQKQTGAAGERLKEAGNINKSLSQLGNVINILAEVAQTGKHRHIPYRDSRLTFLLQESLGGNAKLAMICAISPASSCRSETLSTLRFAQRAKAVQNKAVVNEETASDVNLLREQIRQLKDELMRMKTNGSQETGTGGYSNGWNARRSYNLLRLSLSHPMNISAADLDPDNDFEMEIDEDDPERDEPVSKSSAAKGVAARLGTSRLGAIGEKDWLSDTPMEVESSEICVVNSKDVEDITPDGVTKIPDLVSENNERDCIHEFGTGLNLVDDTPNLRTPESVKLPDLVLPKLHSPPLSVSPRLRGSTKRSLTGSPLAPRTELVPHNSVHDSLGSDELYHSTQERFAEGSTSQSLQLRNQSVVGSAVRASMSSTAKPTERLAACLHRGLQILDNQQRTSMAAVRSSTAGLRFSMQNTDFRIPKFIEKADKSVQTISSALVTSSTSPLVFASKSTVPLGEISSCNLQLALAESTNTDEVGTSTLSMKDLLQESDGSYFCNLDLAEIHTTATETPSVSISYGVEELGEACLQITCTSLAAAEDVLHKASSSLPQVERTDLQLTCATIPTLECSQQQMTRSSSPGVGNTQLQVASTQTMEAIVEGSSSHSMPNNYLSISHDASQWQLVTVDAAKSVSLSAGNHTTLQLAAAVENLLTGAIRRERVAEELVYKQAAEIEQLNRLVRQYKHERECNAILHQTREDKIARLESLMENVIPADEYLNEEWSALLLEHQLLQEKFDNHPEVTNSSVEQQRLLEELNKYRMFFDLGEREVLLEEITQLRNQLQSILGNSGIPTAGRNRRLSLTRKSIQIFGSTTTDSKCSDAPQITRSLHLIPSYQDNTASQEQDNSAITRALVVTDARSSEQLRREEEKQEWEARERDWMSGLEEMREEVESYKRIAEKKKQEFESEKRCAEEVQEALQMAMAGHARLLEQYAELQEKHIGLLAKQRKIREATGDVKKMAKRAGVSNFESRWLDAQATQMAAIKVEFDEERRVAKEEIQGLQAQLRDTAEAVQAAGELLVRLKEAEESVMVAQDAAAIAEQNADARRRELEKTRRRHATEIATLQQRLLESRLQKTAVCPMCVMAERVKFQFTEVDAETAQATIEAEARAMALQEEKEWMSKQRQLAAEEEKRMRSEHDMDDYASVRTGEFENHDYDSEEALQLEESDDLDHLFMPSDGASVTISTP